MDIHKRSKINLHSFAKHIYLLFTSLKNNNNFFFVSKIIKTVKAFANKNKILKNQGKYTNILFLFSFFFI